MNYHILEVLEGLNELTIEFEKGTFVVKRIANMLLVLKASAEAPLGAVHQKKKALVDYLRTPLSVVSNLQIQSDIAGWLDSEVGSRSWLWLAFWSRCLKIYVGISISTNF